MEIHAPLRVIELIDVREGGVVRHARERADLAHALHRDCMAWGPLALMRPLMPVLDRLARSWFRRSSSPYIGEIEAVATTLGFSGTWFLNGSYQWGCTSLARDERGAPWLARTLDWPLPGMGRHVDVAHMRGPAGDFYNVTWPGYVGVLTATAPGRFAAAINQAPLRRRSHSRVMRLPDMVVNAVNTWRHVRHIPPDQLLRQVFETCASFAEARAQLETVSVARPVIYTLVGCAVGERCVIERTEEGFRTRSERACAANDWEVGDPRYEARLGARKVFTLSYAEAAANSRERSEAVTGWQGAFTRDSFAWVAPPVLNRYTRLATEMCPSEGILRVVGYETHRGVELPKPATAPYELTAERIAA